jgi:hypothetical protein
MIHLRIDGTTRVLGKCQGYLGLCIKDATMSGGTPVMESAWEPTPEELGRLVNGAPIILQVLGTEHPPVKLIVGG